MSRKIEIAILKDQQADKRAWDETQKLARTWNKDHKVQITNTTEFEYSAVFENREDPELKELLNRVEKLKREYQLRFHQASIMELEADDYAKADLISVIGNSYGKDFLLNENEALGPSEPCRRCGYADEHSRPQLKPFVVNVRLLDQAEAGKRKWLDIMNMPNGSLLISAKVINELKRLNANGFELLEVIEGKNGRVSNRVFQLRAKKAIVEPCLVHTEVFGGEVCPVCGTYYGNLLSDVFLRKDWIGSDDIFSMHPLKATSIFLTNKLFHQMLKLRVEGLINIDIAYICDHSKKD